MILKERCDRNFVDVFLLLLLCALLTWPASLAAQTPKLEPNRSGSVIPVVTYDMEFPGANPAHFAVAVDSSGNAAYRSDPLVREGQAPGGPYITKFTVSAPTRDEIFVLARKANYFNGRFDYTKTRIANTGVKTLTYLEGHIPNDLSHPDKGVENQTTYNWSANPAIQELTRIFQGISTTLEFGQRLGFKRRFDKLGLDAELKRMQEMEKNGQLLEVQAVAPVLNNIANDFSLMHMDRELAKRILADAGQH